jgi:EAL domain-containing protein (putative c-di-GMP-specific phosphodiesterase class I)
MMRDADLAMYRAKSLGKARSEIFDHTMHANAVARLRLETDLRRAVQENEFVLHYQPIIDLDSKRTAGVEALVRWQRPGVGLVTPGEFIHVTEDTGLILPLGLWVLREACRKVLAWRQANPDLASLKISVNVSPRQFAQPELVDNVAAIFRETGVDPSQVRLEITEGVTMGEPERAVRVLTALRELGVKLSLDDFGTGYSSLSYLHRFPLDILKIDRSFVARIDRDGLQIVQAILSLAQNLGMQVVAEGAETAEQVETLRSLGCRYAQGYYFSKPVDANEIEGLLQRSWS